MGALMGASGVSRYHWMTIWCGMTSLSVQTGLTMLTGRSVRWDVIWLFCPDAWLSLGNIPVFFVRGFVGYWVLTGGTEFHTAYFPNRKPN